MTKIKVSVVTNISIFVVVTLALILGLAGVPSFETGTTSFGELMKYFTIESNIFMGIMALLLAINQILYLKNNTKINKAIFILYYVATVCVAITFFTVLFFLAPVVYRDQFWSMYTGISFYYHFLIPVVAMIMFLFVLNTNEYSIKISFFGIIPFLVYALFYVIAALTHMDGGKVMPGYDWYGFLSFGIPVFLLLLVIMLGATYLVSFLIYFINKKLYKLH